jgi:hypothetical protein
MDIFRKYYSDNTDLNPGSGGDKISSDDLGGGLKVQRVKIQYGDDGFATDVSVANPLPVVGVVAATDGGGSLTVDGTVAISNLPSVQPVNDNGGSLTVDSLQLPSALDADGGLKTHVQNTVAVTGPLTDVQLRAAALPVSGPLTDAQLRASALPVAQSATVVIKADSAVNQTSALKVDGSGATQPISGTVAVSNLPATQPVSIAAVVPVSDNGGSLTTDTTQLPSTLGQKTSANSLGVVIASDQGSVAVTGPLTDSQIRATALPVSIAAVIPVSDNSGSLTVDAPVGTPLFVRLSDGAAAQIGQKAMAASLPVTIASDQSAVPVSGPLTDTQLRATAVPISAPTLTKGTQGNGFSTQDLKDAGRVAICLTAEFTFAQTAETLLTMTESRDGGATATFTSKLITSGKRLRIAAIFMEVESLGSGTAPQRAYLRLRVNTAGATIASSPLQGVWSCVNSTAVVKSGNQVSFMIPDGLEYLGDGTKTYGFTLETPDWVTATATGRAKITIILFEY